MFEIEARYIPQDAVDNARSKMTQFSPGVTASEGSPGFMLVISPGLTDAPCPVKRRLPLVEDTSPKEGGAFHFPSPFGPAFCMQMSR